MDQPQRTELLRIARRAITDDLQGRRIPVPCEMTFPAVAGGAFVTLRRAKRLCGCMGMLTPKPTIPETIEYAARLACKDPRFVTQPVTLEEFPGINLEISVLSPPELTKDPASLRIGEHGILIQRGDASGCFLPQVAVEHQWGVEEFLDQCCTSKAGLPAGAWKEPDTQVHLFEAEVFGE